jgi:hypothetical protein
MSISIIAIAVIAPLPRYARAATGRPLVMLVLLSPPGMPREFVRQDRRARFPIGSIIILEELFVSFFKAARISSPLFIP